MIQYDLSQFGLHIISGVSGIELNDTDKRILETVRPTGILFLKRNFEQGVPYAQWFDKFANLISALYEYTGRDKLLLTIDHEGGQVQRTPAPITNFGTPASYLHFVKEVGAAMANDLKSLGINLSWAPLCDINTNPDNPIIGKLGRAFSESAIAVSNAAVAFHYAMTKGGVLTCAKHFPGHGDTWSDSHLELPSVDVDENTLLTRELVPFRSMVNAGVEFIMTAHVMFPKIDAQNPATLSPKLISEILRSNLGYKGIVIADDINMKAVAERFQSPLTVAAAINAGVDMFIIGRYPDADSDDSPIRLAQHIAKTLEDGGVALEMIETVRTRIESMLERIPRYTPRLLQEAELNSNAAILQQIELARTPAAE